MKLSFGRFVVEYLSFYFRDAAIKSSKVQKCIGGEISIKVGPGATALRSIGIN
jgi:hypothetical protein